MRKMKNYLKTGILLIGILFTLTNCEKENTIELNQINNPIIYKVTSLDNLFELKPIIENVKNVKSKGVINYKSSVDFLNLANINTNEIIQYTNETGYSTYTFKFENNPGTINFENLHLIEVDNGFIAYILSYEPDSEWYYSNISPEGDLYFDLSTYKGNITKYSLEKEIIWTTNNELINKFSKNSTTSKTSGGFMQVCVISMQPMCDYGGTLHPWGDKCTGNRSYDITETCQTVWAGGGDNTNPDDDGTTGGTGGGTGIEDCTNVTGTSIQDSLPLSGISSDCSPNTTIGLAYQTFWMSLSDALQDYLDFRPKTKATVMDYLYINKYAPQAQLKVENVTNEAIAFSKINYFSLESEIFSELAIEALLKEGKVDYADRIIIDSSFVKSKAYCAYKLLKDNVQFNKILDSLIPKDSKYNVIFKVGDVKGTATGSTNPNTDPNVKNIPVTIDDFHSENSSIISVALTILHESVHARLIAKVKSLGGLGNLTEFAYLDSEMEQLAAFYNKYDGEHNPAHHDFIWDNYVDKLAYGVESFHKLFPEDYITFHNNYMTGTTGYNRDTFYKLAAKGSLHETSYFKNLSTPEQEIILNMASALKDFAKKITDQINCK